MKAHVQAVGIDGRGICGRYSEATVSRKHFDAMWYYYAWGRCHICASKRRLELRVKHF